MYIMFNGWCADGSGVIKIFKMLILVLNVIRIGVPIALIIWTVIDLMKNVIDPDNKDSKKKITTRIIAAIIVFLIPTIVDMVMGLVNVGLDNNVEYNYTISDCWKKAKK